MTNSEARMILSILACFFAVSNTSVSGIEPSLNHKNPPLRYQYPSDCLRDMLSDARKHRQAIRIVGVHDALSARIIQHRHTFNVRKAQNEAQKSPSSSTVTPMGLFVSGFGVSAARLGKPDMSIVTRYEQEDTARNIIQSVCSSSEFHPPPVIVDGDT